MAIMCTLTGFNSTATYLHVRHEIKTWLLAHRKDMTATTDRTDAEVVERATGIAGAVYQAGMVLGIALGDILAGTSVLQPP